MDQCSSDFSNRDVIVKNENILGVAGSDMSVNCDPKGGEDGLE
jgi:hypothetical protein